MRFIGRARAAWVRLSRSVGLWAIVVLAAVQPISLPALILSLAACGLVSAQVPTAPPRPEATPTARPPGAAPVPAAPSPPTAVLQAHDLEEVREAFIKGLYRDTIRLCEAAIADQEAGEDWRLILLRSLMAAGEYDRTLAVATEALERYPRSIQLRLAAREVFLFNDEPERARELLLEIDNLAGIRFWAYRDPANMVALGRAAVLLGADPRRVLEQFYDPVKKAAPELREVHLASGELALEKSDFALAGKIFADGLKRFPSDPDFNYGLARAYANSDRRKMIAALNAAVKGNTNHAPSFLLLADHLIDGEEYETADETLEKALEVNRWLPEAWAYRAVLKHLANDVEGEKRARESALRFWKRNPHVHHLIGRKLAQKYRFSEGAAAQREALLCDPAFLPAKMQLAQDLLRLGEEVEGWRLAGEVHKQDGYNVAAYNLVTLQESLAKFKTLTNEHFILRMSAHEAAVYGDRVLSLLERARDTLAAKYGLELPRPTTVEIFPEQKDFGVRTFGMPDNPGFLGVCFGSVITANSPASQGANPSNWEAVLWHEFCHVITLQLTRNKMPRWLSEGISVYEERQANRTWGQSMTPQYRQMVLGDELTPVGDLSAAFLAPKSDRHLQFAYYESSLVVEFLVENFGLSSLKQILADLSAGMEINAAIEDRCAPLEEIEADFAAFARKRAKDLAPSLDFEEAGPDHEEVVGAAVPGPLTNNYYVLMNEATGLLREKKWEQAKVPLKQLIASYPDNDGPVKAFQMLATAHRHLEETNLERQVLLRLAEIDAEATDAYLRLMTLAEETRDWSVARTNAQRFLAVNPLVPQPYRTLARASEELGEPATAIPAYKTLLLLNSPDPAETHYRLARLLRSENPVMARRHLLQSLEEAPRFREAHRLLLEMEQAKNDANGIKSPPPSPRVIPSVAPAVP